METLTRFANLEKESMLRTRFFQSEQEAIAWLVQVRKEDEPAVSLVPIAN